MAQHLYSSRVKPTLFLTLAKGKRKVQVWTTSCIVTNFSLSPAHCSLLINPSNPELSGVRNFPYFPKGGPVPNKVDSMHKDWQPLGFVSSWGGMEVGSGMLYPISVVDGLVHQLGGWKLRAECDLKHSVRWGSDTEVCPVGSAVLTQHACDELKAHYEKIIHTTPPFFAHDKDPRDKLHLCYTSALALAASEQCDAIETIACPLIGAGARGFPAEVALRIAARAARDWIDDGEATHLRDQTLAFGLLEEKQATSLCEIISGLSSSSQ